MADDASIVAAASGASPPPPSPSPELASPPSSSLSLSVSERVAQTALRHYHDVLPPNGGKPKDENEWTVYAAIVASLDPTTRASAASGTVNAAENSVGDTRCETTVCHGSANCCDCCDCTHIGDTDDSNVRHDVVSSSGSGSPPAASTAAHFWVVSCATGTKCTTLRRKRRSPQPRYEKEGDGGDTGVATATTIATTPTPADDDPAVEKMTVGGDLIVHDSHAEVLARRGLVRVLWEEIIDQLQARTATSATSVEQQHQQEQQQGVGPTTARVRVTEKSDTSNRKRSSQEPANVSQRLLEPCYYESDEKQRQQQQQMPAAQFQLRQGLALHMYCSDSPCGDASIYEITTTADVPETTGSDKNGHDFNNYSNNDSNSDDTPLAKTGHDVITKRRRDQTTGTTSTTLQFTGAKAVVAASANESEEVPNQMLMPLVNHASQQHLQQNMHSIVREPNAQRLGQLRTKSSRSNISDENRTVSMSCSDKICRYQVLGWQSAPQMQFLKYPVRLTSLIVSHDPRCACCGSSSSSRVAADGDTQGIHQRHALQRALSDRIHATSQFLHEEHPRLSWPCRLAVSMVTGKDRAFTRGKSMVDCMKQRQQQQLRLQHNDVARTSTDAAQYGCIETAVGASGRKRKQKTDPSAFHRNGSNDAGRKVTVTKKSSPCGFCINWQQAQPFTKMPSTVGDRKTAANSAVAIVEVTVGVRGTRQGKKPDTDDDYWKLRSRLCQHELFRLARLALSLVRPAPFDNRYTFDEWLLMKQCLLRNDRSPLFGWIVGDYGMHVE